MVEEQKKQETQEVQEKKPQNEKRLIVRIANKDLDGTKHIARALQGIKGISHRYGLVIAKIFQRETGVQADLDLGEIPEGTESKIEDIVLHPDNYQIPDWMLNRRKDYDAGTDKHLVMNDLDFQLRTDFQRLSKIKSYRGLRHSWGLPTRGQRTRSTFRKKGAVVGVQKKK